MKTLLGGGGGAGGGGVDWAAVAAFLHDLWVVLACIECIVSTKEKGE